MAATDGALDGGYLNAKFNFRVQSTLANWVMLGPGLLSQLSGLVT